MEPTLKQFVKLHALASTRNELIAQKNSLSDTNESTHAYIQKTQQELQELNEYLPTLELEARTQPEIVGPRLMEYTARRDALIVQIAEMKVQAQAFAARMKDIVAFSSSVHRTISYALKALNKTASELNINLSTF